MGICIVFVSIALLYVFVLRGRTGHNDFAAIVGWSYAHRGLHGNGVPENSIAAFDKALNAGYGIELDVHLMLDGKLAVIHDSSLKRTTGADVMIEDITANQLDGYCLEGTAEKVPLLSNVLELLQGKAPLIIELKSTKKNYAQLCQAACNLLDTYSGPYCIESFDSRCVAWLRKNRKDIIRGQLAEDFFRSGSKLPFVLKFALKYHLFNFITRPDFVAYRFEDRKNLSNFLCRKLWGVKGFSWTIRTIEDYKTAVSEGLMPIFENFRP